MNDEEILERGGTEEDIQEYAKQNGADLTKEDVEVCQTCGGTGEVSKMEAVYPGEPHMADVGTAPCPDCQNSEPDDDHE